MSQYKPTFEVNVKGLARVALRKGASFVLLELLANALDEDITEVRADLQPIQDRRARASLVVTDDSPTGFRKLEDAYTLYGDSYKASDPNKRGVFDVGEKHVISICEWAEIKTTTGTISFDENGRIESRARQERGTTFSAVVKLTREQQDEALAAARQIIPPPGKRVVINGIPLPERMPLTTIQGVTLDTVFEQDGELRRTRRQTTLNIYRVLPGEVATLFDQGMPVVETGDSYHVVVEQRVPLNIERDNVPPAFLKSVRVAVLNVTADMLTDEQATQTWVREAVGDERVKDDVARAVLTKRFGDKIVAGDPTDPEAMKEAVRQGYTIVHGGSLSKDEWAIVKRAEAVQPAGQVFPTHHPNYADPGDPNAHPENRIPSDAYSPGMRYVVGALHRLARICLGKDISIIVVNDRAFLGDGGAWYGSSTMHLNVIRLGYKWFERGLHPDVIALGLHELAHDRVSDHLSKEFPDEIARLAGVLVQELLVHPGALEPEFDLVTQR